MADYVISASVTAEDNVSAAMNAAAASLDRVADSMDVVEASTTRATKSGTAYVNQNDATSAALANMQRRLADAAAGQAAMQASLDAGKITAEQFGGAMDGLNAKVDAARARVAAARAATVDMATGTTATTAAVNQSVTAVNQATTAHGALSSATAGVTRELLVLGHEAITGNYTRMGGSLVVLAERTNALHTALGVIGPALSGIGGAFTLAGVAAVGALSYMAVQTEEASRRLDDLSAHLRVTRSDYAALAAAGETAARSVASTSTVGVGDARTAYSTLAAVPDYHGTTDQLQDLIRLSGDVARAFAEDVPKAAEQLATALHDPAAAAKKLADEGFAGMNQAQSRAIELMQASGNMAGAQAAVLDAYKRTVGGVATEGLTPLQKALNDLSNAFTSVGKSGKSLQDELGGFVLGQITQFVQDIKNSVDSIKNLRDQINTLLHTSGPSVDQETGRTPNVSIPLQKAAPYVTGQIYQLGAAEDINRTVRGLATRVAYQESGGQQFGRDGQVLTSSAGALGVMQLMPGTAADKSINPDGSLDPSRVDDNILLGLRYLASLSKRFNGNEADIAGAYNMGPGGYQAYLDGKRELPQETQNYVHNVAGVALPISRTPGASAAIDVPMSAGMPDSVAQALKLPDSTTLRSLDDADAKISLLVKAVGDLSASGVTSGKTWDTLQAQLAAARGKYGEIGTAVDLANRHVEDGLAPLSSATGAARTLATAQNELTLAARAQGTDVTQEQRTARNTLEQQKLTAAFNDGLDALNRQTAGQEAVNAVYSQGAASVIEAQNAVKAAIETENTAERGTAEYTRQLALKTDALNRASAAQATANTLQKAYGQQDQLDTIRTETALLGANADVQARDLALLKERQALLTAGGTDLVNSAAGQASLARVAQIANETAAYEHQKDALNELANFGTSAFDKIGTAITQAFATGTKTAIDFGSIAKSVISEVVQEALKLSVLNPLKNMLFGQTNTTISDVGGVLGLLGGGGASQVVSNQATRAVATAGDGTLNATEATFGYAGSGSTAAGSSATSTAYDLGKMVFSGAGGQAIGNAIAGALGQTTEQIASTVTNVALANATGIGGAAVSGVATTADLAAVSSTQIATASAAQAAGASAGAAASAASTVSQAIPYIGAAVGVATQLVQGNYTGAALVAGGAAIGSIIPGVGTAIGAAIGGLASMFIGGHKKNPYEAIDVNATDGQLARGTTLSQLVDPAAGSATVDQFAAGVNAYDAATGLKLANANGRLAIYGTGADPKVNNYVGSTDDLFKTLRFTAANDDGTNFSIAKAGALPGQQFNNVGELQTALTKVASFSDGLDALGLQLKSVGNDLVNIQIAGLKDGAPSSDLETAFAHDLPGQTFADQTAFEAEITKINNFVNGTIPSLLDPVFQTVTPLQKQIQDTVKTYADAIAQAQAYGLATDGLTAAQAKAIAILQQPAIADLAASNLQIVKRGEVAAGQNTDALDLQLFDADAAKQRQSLIDSYTNIWGSLIPVQEQYGAAAKTLDQTLASERLALQKQQNDALIAAARKDQDGSLSLYEQIVSIRDRDIVATSGANVNTDTDAYNTKAIEETKSYSRALLDYYGQAFASSTDYQNRMTELEQTQNAERLAIVTKYNQQIIAQDNAIAGTVTNLATYARGLQTSALSPLSPQAQLSLARTQFNAVSGSAAAGDYGSIQQVQTFADSFLNASRAVNGSGAAYVADFDKVLTALDTVGSAKQDTLTASYQASLVQNQTDQLVTELQALRSEVAALRLETQQGSAAPARVAA